jgi:hypothetical protein
MKEDSPGDAEDGAIGAYAETERENGGNQEARASKKRTDGVPKVHLTIKRVKSADVTLSGQLSARRMKKYAVRAQA